MAATTNKASATSTTSHWQSYSLCKSGEVTTTEATLGKKQEKSGIQQLHIKENM